MIRVTLRDGTYHEDVGYGVLENTKQKGPALDKVRSDLVPICIVQPNVYSAKRRPSQMASNGLYETLGMS